MHKYYAYNLGRIKKWLNQYYVSIILELTKKNIKSLFYSWSLIISNRWKIP